MNRSWHHSSRVQPPETGEPFCALPAAEAMCDEALVATFIDGNVGDRPHFVLIATGVTVRMETMARMHSDPVSRR